MILSLSSRNVYSREGRRGRSNQGRAVSCRPVGPWMRFPISCLCLFPAFVGCVSQPLSLFLNEKPFRPHPSVSVDRPVALVSFSFPQPQCSKYERKGPVTNLAVHSAGFQYGLSLVGFFPPLIINWQTQKQLWPYFFLLIFAGTSAI